MFSNACTYFLMCLCFAFTPFVNGEVIERIDNSNGLSSDLVNSIYQDNYGYIWAATADGLNCYTGTEFIVYKHKKGDVNSIASSNIHRTCMDKSGLLWISTRDKGISILNPITQEIRHLNTRHPVTPLSHNTTRALLCDSRGRMWIPTQYDLNLYLPEEDRMVYFNDKQQRMASCIYETSNGEIIASSWTGIIYRFDEEMLEFVPLEIVNGDLNGKTINLFLEDKQGFLWIGLWGDGLYKARLYDGKITVLDQMDIINPAFAKEDSYNIVYDLAQDVHNNVWVGTDVGLGRIVENTNPEIAIEWIPTGTEKHQFVAKDAKGLYVDKANTLWISTLGNGMFKIDYNLTNFKTYKSPSSQFASNIFSSMWTFDDELYTGIHAMVLAKYDLDKGELTPFNQLPAFDLFQDKYSGLNSIVSCQRFRENKYWMLSRYKGVFLYDTKTYKVNKLHFPLDCDEHSCFLLESPKVWVGTPEGLILCTYDKLRKGVFPYKRTLYRNTEENPNILQTNSVSAIHRDKQGNVWISYASGGIDQVIEDPEDPSKVKFKRVITKDNAFFPDITLMHEDSCNNLWVGTKDAGLALFKPKSQELINFSERTMLHNKTICAIEEDDDNRLWLSTNHGLFSFNHLDLAAPFITNYNIEDGLQGNIFIENSSFKDKEGRLYFGGYNGFNCFDPSEITYNTYVPPLVLSEIKIDHKPHFINYIKGEVLELNHKNNSIQLTFNALSYTKSYNNQYQYKLEGWDDKWINVKDNNNATYGILPPGKYKFKVRGSNNNGVWNNDALTLDVHVKKAYYKTFLAYLIYVLILFGFIYFYIYYTQRNFKLSQAYKEEQNERQRSEKINQFKLKFFTNISHELLTPLSIISNATEQFIAEQPSNEKKLAVVTRNTNRLSRLINQLLDFRKVEGDSLALRVCKCGFGDLASSLKDNFEPLCENKNITFKVNGKINHDIYFDLDKVDKMLHNILSNAYKHTPTDGFISLDYDLKYMGDTETLVVRILDNGPGIPKDQLDNVFERFYRIDDQLHESGAGIGLAFTKALVKLHKGTIEAANHEAGGALFTLSIPVSECVFTDEELDTQGEPPQLAYSFAEEMDVIKTDIRLSREADSDLPKVLIVEDNIDMRTIIKNYLKKYFDVYESNNGVEGLEVLEERDIELIISDVMMPKMDGLTFCKRVKSGISTSHIPVILTTAKRTQQNYIEGYEAQADSYITKPINLPLLLVRIINLLNQRQSLRHCFAGTEKPDLKKLVINSLDQEFLEKLNAFIDENIDNNNLTIGMFSEHVNISSSVFYRKLKSYTGMSPKEYLCTKRMNKAAELLKTGINASSVGYECGYSDPSYFGVAFKKHFGMPPKKYIESL